MIKRLIRILNKNSKTKNNLTVKRKEEGIDVESVTLARKSLDEYCFEREKRLSVILGGLSLQ